MTHAATYAFGEYVFIPRRQLLLKNGQAVRIGCRALDLLAAFVQRPGEVLSKQELLEEAWPTTTVVEGNLKVHIAAAAHRRGPAWPSGRAFPGSGRLADPGHALGGHRSARRGRRRTGGLASGPVHRTDRTGRGLDRGRVRPASTHPAPKHDVRDALRRGHEELRREAYLATLRFRKSRISGAISFRRSSSAKWPLSRMWISALGRSRR
jgi:hypothetical protein